MVRHVRSKSWSHDYVMVAYVGCDRCHQVTAIVIRREIFGTATECAYCGVGFSQTNSRVRKIHEYSISRWKEEFLTKKHKRVS